MKSPIDKSNAIIGELVLVDVHGAESSLAIRIGLPVKQKNSWACPCEIAGRDGQYEDIVGADPIQAIALALKLVRTRLASLIASGNSLYLPSDRSRALTESFVNFWFGV